MHRPTLILRRFGELSVGLGYFEGGTWVDHASAAADGVDFLADPATSSDERAALTAIHTWFDCCREQVEVPVVVDGDTISMPATAGSASSSSAR